MDRNLHHLCKKIYCYLLKANNIQGFIIKCRFDFFLNWDGCSVFTNVTKASTNSSTVVTAAAQDVYNYLGGGEGDNTGELGVCGGEYVTCSATGR
jgi:hypothetical protein